MTTDPEKKIDPENTTITDMGEHKEIKSDQKGKILSLDVSALFISQIFAFGISTLIPIILARTLSPHNYGIYRELLLVFTTLNPIFQLGIPHSIKYFYPRYNKAKKRSLLTQTTYILLLMSLFFLLILLLIGVFGGFFGFEPNWSNYFILLGLYAFFNLNVAAYITILVVVDRIKFASAIYIVFAVIDVILISLFGYIFHSITSLLIAMVIADFVKFLIFLFFCQKEKISFIKGVKPKFIKTILAYSVPIGFSSFISIINNSIDKYFIAFYFAPAIYMLYHWGSYQLPPLHMLISSVTKVLVPALSREHKRRKFKNIITLWHETLRKMSILFLPLFGFLMISANELLIVLFTEQYTAATPVFRIYLFMVPLRIFFFTWMLMATGHAKYLFKLSVATIIANFILNLILINYIEYFGIESLYGPAIATVIVIYFSVVASYYKSKHVLSKYIDTPIVPWLVILKIGIITFIASILTYLLGYQMLYQILITYHPIVLLLFSFSIFSICYFGLMFKTQLIKREDINSIKLFFTGKF